MQIKNLILAATLAVTTIGCNDDAPPDPVDVPGDGDGIEPDGDGDGDVGQSGEELDPDEPAPDHDEPLEPADEWLAQLDYVIAHALEDGYQLTAYNNNDDEIGWLVVVAGPEVIVLEHRYFRPCEFNEVDCFDGASTVFSFADEPDFDIGHTIPRDVAHRRAKAIIVLAGQHPQPFGKHLKCALTLASPLVECGIVGDFNPDTCIGSILAALCACRDAAKKIFPELNIERLKKLCDD